MTGTGGGTGLRVGVDIGGTKIAAGVVDTEGTIVRMEQCATPTAAEIPDAVRLLVRGLTEGEDVAGVGIGAAGFVGADRRTIIFAPNIDWRDEPLAERVEDGLGVPVVVENDANAAAWGEFRFGAGRDVDDMLLITVGTGVGGGIVHDGRIYRGGHGIAAEVGHVRLVPGGLPCGCGQRGCLEQYASGTALVRRAREVMEPDDPTTPVSGHEVTRRAAAGDPEALAVLADVGHDLGQGIATMAAVLDPQMVVIGGGVAEAGTDFVDPVRRALELHLTATGRRPGPVVRPALLGNDAGLVGAADLSVRTD